MTIFGSFEIGRKALRAQHKGMEVSGQNVANANTPGYSRQRTNLVSVESPIVANADMAPGDGVRVSHVERMYNEFYQAQVVNSGSYKAYWDMRRETSISAESIFMEPDDYGINKSLGEFFDTWQELSSSPEEAAVRSGLRENAVSLTASVEDVYERLEDMRLDKLDELDMRVGEANRVIDEIGELNDKLRFVDALDKDSNEMLDKLDLAIEELSELIDIQVYRKSSGAVDIFAGGQLIVQEDRAFHMELETAGEEGVEVVNHRGKALNLTAGRITGLTDAVNKDLPHIQEELDKVVEALVEEVNGLHREGFGLDKQEGGIDFFETIPEDATSAALNFRVSQDILDDSSKIAASAEPGEPGNGEIALKIGQLRDYREEGRLDSVSIEEYYRGLITSMGVEAQESERMAEAFGRTKDEFEELKSSASGVNMDEEMLKMTEYQHAWNAAARYLSTVDEMLTSLFTELGR